MKLIIVSGAPRNQQESLGLIKMWEQVRWCWDETKVVLILQRHDSSKDDSDETSERLKSPERILDVGDFSEIESQRADWLVGEEAAMLAGCALFRCDVFDHCTRRWLEPDCH